jgi:hypothetical protein
MSFFFPWLNCISASDCELHDDPIVEFKPSWTLRLDTPSARSRRCLLLYSVARHWRNFGFASLPTPEHYQQAGAPVGRTP